MQKGEAALADCHAFRMARELPHRLLGRGAPASRVVLVEPHCEPQSPAALQLPRMTGTLLTDPGASTLAFDLITLS